MRELFAFAIVASTLGGCSFPCDPATRLDGSYAVWMHTVTHTPAPPFDEYPSYQAFYNGWSEWSLNYVPAKKAFDLVIDDQTYTADYGVSDAGCGTFTLAASGIYVTIDGSRHHFEWDAELAYYGSHMNGTYNYVADWEYALTDSQGSVEATGEIMSTRIEGQNFDTGFEF